MLPTSGPTTTETVVATLAPADNVGGPYGGVAAVVPGVIEVEEFDEGGEGVAYSDTDTENNGGVRGTERAQHIRCSSCVTFPIFQISFVLGTKHGPGVSVG